MPRPTAAKLLVLGAYLVPLAIALVFLLANDDWIIALALALVEGFVFLSIRVAAGPAVEGREDRVRPVRGAPGDERPSDALRRPEILVMAGTFLLVLVGVVIVVLTSR